MNIVNFEVVRGNRRKKKPLFNSYVFVNVSEKDISKIKELNGVINVLYWKGQPALIETGEIEALNEVTYAGRHVKLERIGINGKERHIAIDRLTYSLDGTLVAVENRTITINLPSVEVSDEGIFAKKTTISHKNSFSYS